MKLFWLLLIVLISSCNNNRLVNISGEGLSNFHSEKNNWILSHKMLTEPKSVVADTFWLDVFSDDYRYFEEEPLFTESQNAEILRVSFIESFNNHTLFNFISRNDNVQLIEKELENQILYSKRDSSSFTMGWYEFNSTYDTINEYRRISNMDNPIAREFFIVGEYDPLVSEENRQVSNSKWNTLVNLINSNEFRELSPTDQHCCNDGYNMIIEIHNSTGYHLYTRQNPEDAVTIKIIEQLLELSSNENFKELHGDNI